MEKFIGIERAAGRGKRRELVQAFTPAGNRSGRLPGTGTPPRLVSTQNGTSHEASYLLSRHHLRHLNSKMKLPKFLRPPGGHRRQRSKARSEINLTEGQSEVGSAAQRHTESTPDLRPSASMLPTPSPSAARDKESNGVYMSTIPSRTINLRTFFA